MQPAPNKNWQVLETDITKKVEVPKDIQLTLKTACMIVIARILNTLGIQKYNREDG